MSQSIAIFNQESAIVSYADKKGNTHEISAEGALFKGGAALKSLKNQALDSALIKAANGKYRTSADILAASFPSIAKAFDKLHILPWSNKSTMNSYLLAMEYAEPGKNGWTAKQSEARLLMQALRQLPGFAKDANEAVTIDA